MKPEISVQVPLLLILQLYHNTRLCRSIFAKKEHQTQITAQQVSVIDLNALWPPPIIQHRRKKESHLDIFGLVGLPQNSSLYSLFLSLSSFSMDPDFNFTSLPQCLFCFLLGVTIFVWTAPHTQTPCLPSLALGASVSVYKNNVESESEPGCRSVHSPPPCQRLL